MSEKLLKVGIAGLGTVGAGVVKTIQNNAEMLTDRTGCKIEITAVSARSKDKDRGVNLNGIKWYKNAVDIANDDNVDLVVELIGGDSGAAYDLCIAALNNGKNFVTANKALVARHGKKLADLAEKNNVNIAFEAAVAGGIPVIKTLKEGLAGNNIGQISGILNGTCNYMLTTMTDNGLDFDDILKEAQELGYAEADPTFDIGGIDAAHKLAIMTSIAFGTEVNFDAINISGITNISLKDTNYAKELGYKIKLLGICNKSNDGIEQVVAPFLIKKSHPLSSVDGVDNAIFIEGDAVGKVVLQGPGAGEGPTASSVVADIVDMASGRFSYAFNTPSAKLVKANFIDASKSEGEYYIRISVKDESGVLADISDILKDSGISASSVLQKSSEDGQNPDIIVITHKIFEKTAIKAVEKIEKVASVVEKPNVIKIES